jgi:hypothetical protein
MYRLIMTTFLVFSLSAAAETQPTEDHTSGLLIIEQDRYGEFLVAGDVDWAGYTKISLDRAQVTFRERWVRDQRQHHNIKVRKEDQERIKSEMADVLDQVLTRQLPEKGDYVMTDESGVDVMRISPRIVDLDVIVPDRSRDYIGYSFTDSQLSFSLELEIHDSSSDRLLATSWQHLEDPYKGYMEVTNSVTNRQATRLMLQRWVSWFLERMDEAREGESD